VQVVEAKEAKEPHFHLEDMMDLIRLEASEVKVSREDSPDFLDSEVSLEGSQEALEDLRVKDKKDQPIKLETRRNKLYNYVTISLLLYILI